MSVCSVCPVSLTDLLTVAKKGNEEVAWNIAIMHGLIKNTATCSQCHNILYLDASYKFQCYGTHWGLTEDFDVVERLCTTSIDSKSGTLFEFSGQPVSKVLALIRYFLDFDLPVKDSGLTIRVNKQTVTDWNHLFSEVILHYCVHNYSQLGGPGKVVEVQWTYLEDSKLENYHWSVKGQWILAGVESASRESFVLSVDNNPEDILIPLIQQWIHPGSIIIFDCQKDFIKLREVGYTCFTKSCIKEKNLTITSSWMDFKCLFFKRCRRKSFDSFISEAIFCFQWPDKSERFHQFLLAIAKLFPPNY